MSNSFDGRCEVRRSLLMPARMRIGFLTRAHVAVTDLSPNGCRVLANADYLSDNQIVLIQFDQLEPWKARIRWDSFQIGGLEFDRPLYLPIVEHLAKNWQRSRSTGVRLRPFSAAAAARPMDSMPRHPGESADLKISNDFGIDQTVKIHHGYRWLTGRAQQ